MQVLASHVEREDENLMGKLDLVVGAFPHTDLLNILTWGGRKFDLVMSRNVFNMLTYDDLQPAFNAVCDLLLPGGRFFITVLTPYTKIHKQDYRDRFDEQVGQFLALLEQQKKNGFGESSNEVLTSQQLTFSTTRQNRCSASPVARSARSHGAVPRNLQPDRGRVRPAALPAHPCFLVPSRHAALHDRGSRAGGGAARLRPGRVEPALPARRSRVPDRRGPEASGEKSGLIPRFPVFTISLVISIMRDGTCRLLHKTCHKQLY